MKNKTKFLLTTLFILVAFLLLGTTNVNATTVTVETEAQLRDAVSGTDAEITEVKLGDDIILEGDLGIFPVNNLVLDLNGNTIDGQTNKKSIYIRYGKNSLTSGSLTIKDSGESAGSIKAYQNIDIGNYNENTSTEKNYGLIIENGQFYAQGNIWSTRVFELLESFTNRNVTFDFQVGDGYFVIGSGDGSILYLSNSFTKDNIKLNINFDKLTYYGENQTNNKLIYSSPSADFSIKLSDVISDSSKVVLKKTSTGDTATLTDLNVSATSSDPLNTLLSMYNTIEVIKTEGFDVSDVTLNETYGYSTATAKGIKITNRGANALKVKNVSVSSENFIVNDTVGTTDYLELASLESNDTRYTIEAKPGLAAGEYTAVITVTDANDKTYTSTVKVVVAKKPVIGLGVGYEETWKYGETPKTLKKHGVEGLSIGQYVVDYSVHDDNEWSTTVPTLAGYYDVRIKVVDPNYENTSTAISQFYIQPNDTQIRIVAKDNEWTYDGNSHSDNGYRVFYGDTEVTTGELPTGDTISAVVSGSVIDVDDTKTGNNKIDSYTITNSAGIDVKDCYSNIIVGTGNLTIKPIETQIVVTADSDTKEYDGTALEKKSYTYTDGVLVAGDELKATITGSQTYVGTSDNVVSDVQVWRGEKNIFSNYRFGTHINGTLKVTAVDQPLSIADQYVTVNNKILTSTLEQELNGAKGMVSFEVKSGTAGVYNDESYGGFLAGTSVGDVVMTVKATAFDVNNDGTPEYNATEKDFTIHVVIKETVTIGGITNNQEFTYDGTSKTPAGTLTFSNNNVTTSDLEVSYAGTTTNGTAYSSTTAPTNAGTYSVTYKIKDSNANYVGLETFTFKIVKAQLPKVTLVKTSYEYTGANITLEFNNYNNDLMTLLKGWGEVAPLVKNANSYDFLVSLKDKNNYEWSDGTTDNIPLTVVVTKANPSYTIPTDLTGIKGQTLDDIELPSGFTWNDASTALIVGTHTYMAKYTPSDTDNYNTIENIAITIVTNKKVYEVIEGANQEYTITKDSEAKFRVNAGYGLFINGGDVYVDDELVEKENYTSEEGSTVITLKQAYVDTLSVGQHTLKVVFADEGEAKTNFIVAKVTEQPTPDNNPTIDNNNTNTENNEDKGSNPKTFDNIMGYVAIAIMSVVGLGATMVIKKKQEK